METKSLISRRGQSAIEYMVTYGWVLLIVALVAVLLWQMGILEITKDVTPGSRGFSQITPLDWRMTTAGELTVTFLNDAGTILSIPAGGMLASVGPNSCTPEASVPSSDKNPYRPGEAIQITITDCPVTGKAGDYYRVNMTINYNNPKSGISHQSVGVLWGPLE